MTLDELRALAISLPEVRETTRAGVRTYRVGRKAFLSLPLEGKAPRLQPHELRNAYRAVAPSRLAELMDLRECSPGWAAIEAMLQSVYPRAAPMRWGTVMTWAEGGPDPLDSVAAYRVAASDASARHWHYVGFGLSELHEKTSRTKSRSGWGFELTFRLADATGRKPPLWPVMMLQRLARYVFESKRALAPGHYLASGGPITTAVPTRLVGFVLAPDPGLQTVVGPFGKVDMLQAMGITAKQLAGLSNASSDAFVARQQRKDPLLLTDIRW